MSMFAIARRAVSCGQYCKLNKDDQERGGAFTSYEFYVSKDGKEYAAPPGRYVEVLSRGNTVRQNDYIKRVSARLTGLEGEDIPAPPEVVKLCAILSNHYGE
jgi:hypothetical protein